MVSLVAYLDDLMFLSRIRESARAAGLEVRTARHPEGLLEAARGQRPALVLVDLDAVRLASADAVALLRADPALASLPVVGFFSHVHADRAREALAAGCSRVLPRSAFVRELPELLAEAGGPR